MTDAAREHDARYARFAADMLAALAAEEARIARYNGDITLHAPISATAETMLAPTIRPSHRK